MSDEEGRLSELKPARPDAPEPEGRPSYMPRVPWRWVSLVLLAGGLLIGGYFYRQKLRADALREELLSVHREQLGDLARRYETFHERLERWVIQAAEAGPPERFVDPRLNIDGLRSGSGIYLRLPATHARAPEQILIAARSMEQDAITRCMGIAPMSARGLYEKGEFLTGDWVDRLRGEGDLMRLRVIDDQLRRHIQLDAPVVTTMMRADWFMLVVQQGENRRDHPVDVYLWDLREGRQLLRARIQGRGLLVPVRLRFPGVNPAPAPARPSLTSGGAHDCSIASQIRAMTGGPPIDFDSADQVLEAAERAQQEAQQEAPQEGSAGSPSPSAQPAPEGQEPAQPETAPAPTPASPSEPSASPEP